MGVRETRSDFDPTPYVREGVDVKDVLAIREAFDALDENHTGQVEISKLRKTGLSEEFFAKPPTEDPRSSQLMKERVDPFSVLEESEAAAKFNEHNEPINPFGIYSFWLCGALLTEH